MQQTLSAHCIPISQRFPSGFATTQGIAQRDRAAMLGVMSAQTDRLHTGCTSFVVLLLLSLFERRNTQAIHTGCTRDVVCESLVPICKQSTGLGISVVDIRLTIRPRTPNRRRGVCPRVYAQTRANETGPATLAPGRHMCFALSRQNNLSPMWIPLLLRAATFRYHRGAGPRRW